MSEENSAAIRQSEQTAQEPAEEERASHPSTHLRLFTAIELPVEIRARAASFIKTLREAEPEARASWEREEKLHLTLKFFGDIEAQRVEQLSGALSRAASH